MFFLCQRQKTLYIVFLNLTNHYKKSANAEFNSQLNIVLTVTANSFAISFGLYPSAYQSRADANL